MLITRGHKHHPPGCQPIYPWVPWHHHQAIGKAPRRRVDITFYGTFSFICKIIKRLCHKNPAGRSHLHERHFWGRIPGECIIPCLGRKASSSWSCQHCILQSVFRKLHLWRVVAEKWFSSTRRHNAAPLQEKANRPHRLWNTPHQYLLAHFSEATLKGHLDAITG